MYRRGWLTRVQPEVPEDRDYSTVRQLQRAFNPSVFPLWFYLLGFTLHFLSIFHVALSNLNPSSDPPSSDCPVIAERHSPARAERAHHAAAIGRRHRHGIQPF
jgi:hypothetical protein